MAKSRVLLVDDDENDIFLTRKSLEAKNHEVTSASTVIEALHLIATQSFDVLITDLHMPEPGDGYAVVTAMRHTQPKVLTLVVSGYPDVQRAMTAISLEADEIMVKPVDMERVAELLVGRGRSESSPRSAKEGVANILDRDVAITIQQWLSRVGDVAELPSIPLGGKGRSEHIPEMIKNISARLRTAHSIEVVDRPSSAAVAHGQLRHRQGYTAPMIVQESRILQVCIFETIQRNLATVDFTSVLPEIMIIADEVDSQLKQSIGSFLAMPGKVALAHA
jgi:ActR/RegA family two-component response regulator